MLLLCFERPSDDMTGLCADRARDELSGVLHAGERAAFAHLLVYADTVLLLLLLSPHREDLHVADRVFRVAG